MKKVIQSAGIALFVLLLMILFLPKQTATAVDDPVISTKGDRVSIIYKGDPSKVYRVRISNSKGTYIGAPTLEAKGKEETFPMFSGNDTYEVAVLQQTPKGTYTRVGTAEIVMKTAKSSDQFLNSNFYVDYGAAPKTTGQADTLSKSAKGANDQTKAVWDFIRNNYEYDYGKRLPEGYATDLDAIFASKKGVCMDTAAEMAGMLRNIGIPTRFIMGTTSVVEGYHAWIEIQIDKKWVLVDISVDIQKVEHSMANTFGDDATKYKADKIY